MKSLNLKEVTIKDVENFLLDIVYLQDCKTITFEIGEYGMFMFHRLVTNFIEQTGFSIRTNTTSDVEKDVEGQYVKYRMSNGRELLLLHNLKLDSTKNTKIDSDTGFPVKSNILYLKEKL